MSMFDMMRKGHLPSKMGKTVAKDDVQYFLDASVC